MPGNAFGEDSQKNLEAYTLPFMLRLLVTKASGMRPPVLISSGISINSDRIFHQDKPVLLYPRRVSCAERAY